MRRCWRRLRCEAGGALVETALVLPFLVGLVLGGAAVGYMAYARLALTWTVAQAAHEAGATAFHMEIPRPGVAYAYDGFVETYGLPRGHVQAVILREPVGDEEAIHVAACFRIPFALPLPGQGGEAPEEPPMQTIAVPAEIGGIQLPWRTTLEIPYAETMQEYAAQARRVHRLAERNVALARENWERGADLAAQLEELARGARTAVLAPLGRASGDTLEGRARALCADKYGDSRIVTARAAFLGEPPDEQG